MYLENLVNLDRLDRLDSTYIKKRREELKEEIKKLDEQLKNNSKKAEQNKEQIKDFLEFHSKNYKLNAQHRLEVQRIRFIEKAILPQLEKLGSEQTAKEIDDLLINWPEGEA